MEDDIVARLRDCTCVPHGEICREAADEIERLRRDYSEAEKDHVEYVAKHYCATLEIEKLRRLISRMEARRG